jgi:hypothetical protein
MSAEAMTQEIEFCKLLRVKKDLQPECQEIVRDIFSSTDRKHIEEKVKELSRRTGKRLDKVVSALETFQGD